MKRYFYAHFILPTGEVTVLRKQKEHNWDLSLWWSCRSFQRGRRRAGPQKIPLEKRKRISRRKGTCASEVLTGPGRLEIKKHRISQQCVLHIIARINLSKHISIHSSTKYLLSAVYQAQAGHWETLIFKSQTKILLLVDVETDNK